MKRKFTMKRSLAGLLAMMMLTAPVALANEAVATPEPTETAAQATPDNMEDLTMDMNYELLSTLYETQGQCVLSPLGVRIALTMAAEGADGETLSQLLTALGETAPTSIDVSGLSQLKSANAALVNGDAALKEAYAMSLVNDYQAIMMAMDDDVVAQVNEWASEHTDGMIKNFLTEAPDPNTMLILMNALVLDAEWRIPFDAAKTKDGTFHAPDGDVEVPFMHSALNMDYVELDGLQAVKIPYKHNELEMVVMMPKAGGMADMLAQLSSEGLEMLGEFAPRGEVRLALPKFSLESSLLLKDALQDMGVVDAFDQRADFTSISDSMELYLDQVIQKARIDVDEQGTKAGAVTAAMVANKSLVLDSVEMMVDRPFLALVRATETGDVIFAAVVDKV